MFLVLGCCYLIFGGLWVYSDLDDQKANREFRVERCLDAARNPGTGNTLEPLTKTKL